MAGVLIGKVDDIVLTKGNHAQVVMRISTKYEGKIPTDSRALITTGGVVSVGDYFIDILPGKSSEAVKDGGYLETRRQVQIEDMIDDVQQVINGLKTTVSSVNDIVADPRMKQSLRRIVYNVELTTAKTVALTEQLQVVLTHNAADIDGVMANVSQATADFAAVGRDIRAALESGGVEKVQASLDNAVRASENLAAASQKLREFAEDPNVNAQLRQTVKDASEAAAGANEIVTKINSVVNRGKKDEQSVPRSSIPGLGSRFDSYVVGSADSYRFDYNYTFPLCGDDFLRIGAFSIGDGTSLNLQRGDVLNDRSAFRYGLYAGKIGVGYDRKLRSDLNLSLDLYDPNDWALETKMRYDITPHWGAWLGVNNVFDGGKSLVGVQYRK
jgi:phospholipid/cholesterol/gamma-HCH transport system substrate-binding protein